MAKKNRMGRNLDALLGNTKRDRSTDQPSESATNSKGSGSKSNTESQSTSDSAQSAVADVADPDKRSAAAELAVAPPGDQFLLIEIEKIRRGTYQPRRVFDQKLLKELADSIKAEGMIQPLIVREFADAYELVAGERRWRAAQIAGLDRVPAIIRQLEDQSVAAVSLIENIQRKDLNPLEEAAALERLCDEFGMTHKAVAEAVGRSRASVSNLLRLLELNEEVKVLIDQGSLEMGHARALLSVPTARQLDIAQKIIQQGMSVRAVEKYIRTLDSDGNEPVSDASQTAVVDPDIERLCQKLSETLGSEVRIQHRSSGSGKLQISYTSVGELQGILAHIK